MAAYGYVRVSTEEQGRSGLSLEHQQRKVAGYADLHDLTLVDTVADVASAKTLRRDGLTALLARLRSGDVVIVAKLDRLTRSVRDLADLLDVFARRGASLVSVGGGGGCGTVGPMARSPARRPPAPAARDA